MEKIALNLGFNLDGQFGSTNILLMRSKIIIALFFLLTSFCRAQQLAIPTVYILPEDIVQGTIQKFQFGTNTFTVRWTYNQAGAKKMLTFWEAHERQKICTAIGNFRSPPNEIKFHPMPPSSNDYQQWKQGWLEHRTDKFWGVSEKDGDAILAGLKSK